MIKTNFFQSCFVLLLCTITISGSFSQTSDEESPLQIGTRESPPFSYKDGNDEWQGISIELWKRIALETNQPFEFIEQDLEDLLQNVSAEELDAVAGAITVTPEREKEMDFSHTFFASGLGIAVHQDRNWAWIGILSRFLSLEFLSVLLTLAGLLFVVGWLVWVFENKKNQEQFGGNTLQGVFSGFWWSAVTLTTVGYGDKAPLTLGGRIVALIWMFTGIVIISGITASITSALTVTQLESTIRDARDLSRFRVGTLPATTSEEYLR